MTLFEPVGNRNASTLRSGFVPYEAEDAVAQHLLRPHFGDERESLLLAGFDAFQRLVRFERIDGDTPQRCSIPPHSWHALLGARPATVVMAHNHPSGAPWPSDGDVAATHDAALLLRTLGIDLIDHLIFVGDGHFSFRTAEML